MRFGWLVCGVLLGCGGSATPEASAPNDPPASAEEPPEAEASKPPAESPGKADAKSDDEGSSGASADVLNVVLQRVIEDEELDKFLHLTSPGRFPLKIAGKDLPSGVSLTKAGQAVAVVSEPSSKKDAVLVFTQIEVQAKSALVAYRYDVEGIRGTARLAKGEQGWELTSSRIVEH
jgi:hypothetical protein